MCKWWYASGKLDAQIQVQIYRYKSFCIYLCIVFYETRVTRHFTSHVLPAFVDFVWNSVVEHSQKDPHIRGDSPIYFHWKLPSWFTNDDIQVAN